MINVRLLKWTNRIMQIKICGLFQVEDIDYVNEAKTTSFSLLKVKGLFKQKN